MSVTFEEQLTDFELRGQIGLFEGGGAAPNNIIRNDQSWGVRFNWQTLGVLNYVMAGDWQLRIHLERMGGGEYSLPGNTDTAPFVSAPHSYNKSITVPAGTVPAGIYRLVAAVTLLGPGGVPGPIAGFAEAGLVQFFVV